MSNQPNETTNTLVKMGFTVQQLDLGGYVVSSSAGSRAFTTLKEVQDWFVVALRVSFSESPGAVAKRFASDNQASGMRLPQPNTPAYQPPLSSPAPQMTSAEEEDFYHARGAPRATLGTRMKNAVGLGT